MSMAGPALAVLAVAAYAALHSVLASLGAKAQARRLVGPAPDRMYRPGFHILGVLTLTLVPPGLYRYVRPPLSTAGAAFLWLTPIMTTTLLALYSAFTAYLYLGSLHEERRLRAEFGEAYTNYQRRVPRMIPRLRPRPATPPDCGAAPV